MAVSNTSAQQNGLGHVHTLADAIAETCDLLMSATTEKKQWSILDLGAETNSVAKALRGRGYSGEMTAVYFTQNQLHLNQPNQHQYSWSINHPGAVKPLPIRDEYYDLVVACERCFSNEAKNLKATSPAKSKAVFKPEEKDHRNDWFKTESGCTFLCNEAMRVTRQGGYFMIAHKINDISAKCFDKIVDNLTKDKQIEEIESQRFFSQKILLDKAMKMKVVKKL